MRKIAHEVDQLLWRVAEDGDPKAVSDFEARFPDLRVELYRRLEMVRGLRGGQKMARASRNQIPSFRPRAPKPSPVPTRVVWVTSGLVLATLGLASYMITSNFNPPSPVIAPITDSAVGPVTTTHPHNEQVVPPKVMNNEERNPGLTAKPVGTTPKWQQRQTFKFQDMDISVALQVVGQQGGLQVELAPNMPQANVTKTYEDKTAIEVLSDLAQEFGFTYFEQGKGKILVIPAVESNPNDSDINKVTQASTDPAKTDSGG